MEKKSYEEKLCYPLSIIIKIKNKEKILNWCFYWGGLSWGFSGVAGFSVQTHVVGGNWKLTTFWEFVGRWTLLKLSQKLFLRCWPG
jgi:hypothetical protein